MGISMNIIWHYFLQDIDVDEFTIYESFLIFSDYLMLWLLAKYQLKVICKIAMLYKEKVGEKENNKTFLYQSSNPLFASIYFDMHLSIYYFQLVFLQFIWYQNSCKKCWDCIYGIHQFNLCTILVICNFLCYK